MRWQTLRALSLLLACLLPFGAQAAAPKQEKNGAKREAGAQTPPTSTRYTLDLEEAEVRRLYMEGEFDRAIEVMQARLKTKGTLDRGDSIFIFKHLGVMYSAQAESLEKGKWFFHKLLLVDTAAKITDMYASDQIYAIFQRISEEAHSTRLMQGPRNGQLPAATPATRPADDTTVLKGKTPPRPEAAPRSRGRTYFWLSATTALAVGAGLATYFYLADPKLIPGEDYPVP